MYPVSPSPVRVHTDNSTNPFAGATLHSKSYSTSTLVSSAETEQTDCITRIFDSISNFLQWIVDKIYDFFIGSEPQSTEENSHRHQQPISTGDPMLKPKSKSDFEVANQAFEAEMSKFEQISQPTQQQTPAQNTNAKYKGFSSLQKEADELSPKSLDVFLKKLEENDRVQKKIIATFDIAPTDSQKFAKGFKSVY